MAGSDSYRTSDLQARNAVAVAVSTAVAGVVAPAAVQAQAQASGIEEITVTARKREESLQDVSASIQAFTGADLKRQGITNMEDVIRFLPSVSHIGQTVGANKIIFRGVSDNPANFIAASSAALYIDEQPLTQFSVNPEPRLIDIERVESLAGPQGTLYGDSSQSGTLRIITNKPDPTQFAAAAEFMLRTGSDSADSYDVNGMLNLPLIEDKFAIRLVGFTARDGGFVDNVLGVSPQLGTKDNADLVQDDINEVDFSGGRISAKWFVNDAWSVTGALISQKSESEGANIYDPTVGDLQVVRFYKDTRDDEWSQASLTVEGKIGGLDFVSNTSFFDRKLDYTFDRSVYSSYFNYNFCTYDGAVYAPAYCWSGETIYDQDTTGWNLQDQENDRFTQEFRLSKTGDNYRWVLGAFYENKMEQWIFRSRTPEFSESLAYYYWTGPEYAGYTPSGVDPSWWLSADDTEWKQWAVFGNFNYDFNEKWSAEVGLRYFDSDMDRVYYVDKPFIISESYPDVSLAKGGNDDIVPKVALTYRIDDEKMVYALYSEGFRAGGANRNRVPEEQTVFPLVYNADKLKNFEIGTKTRWAGGRAQLNATLFFGQWEDYQIEAVDPSFNPCTGTQDPDVDACGQPFQVVVGNAGDAQQTGLEVEFKAAPNDFWDFGLNLTYVEAETSEQFTVARADEDGNLIPVPKGSRLPNVPELKYTAFAQYTWPASFAGSSEAYLRAQYSYQDDSLNQLEAWEAVPYESARGQFVQPSYSIADVRAGLRGDAWTLELFVNNVGDERAVLYEDDLFFEPFFGQRRVTTNRPREYGIRFAYNWN
jgi:outer membrane receptor protein involved in Fe transport